MELMVSRELVEPKVKMCRRLSKVNHEALGLKLGESVDWILSNADDIDVSMLAHEYEVEIKGVLDEISPMVKVKQKTKIPFPWMTEDVKREVALRRSKEWKWKAFKSQYDYRAFSYQRSYVKCMIKWAKKEYFHDVFGEIRDDYKEVFRVAKKLLFNEKQSPFPEAPDDKILGNLFNDFFMGKIEKNTSGTGVLSKNTRVYRIILSNQ